jgi:predicted PurR-regulated permease PerM
MFSSAALAQAEGSLVAAAASPTTQPWLERIINDPVNLISVATGLIGVILGIIPLILYFYERKNTRNLNAVVGQYALLRQIELAKEAAEAQQEQAQAELSLVSARAAQMQEDIEKKLPNAAQRAYYINTIPQVEIQIHDLGVRLHTMKQALVSLTDEHTPISVEVSTILSEVVSEHVTARRRMEQDQIILVILTALTSSILAIVPYPLNIFIPVPSGIIAMYMCYRLVRAARRVYPDSKFLNPAWTQERSRKILICSAVAFLAFMLCLLGSAGFILTRGFGRFL